MRAAEPGTESGVDLDALREVTAAATEVLSSPPRRVAAVTYLRHRGIDPATLPDWPLSYAPPGWTRLVDTLHDRFPDQALLDSGLAYRSSRGTLIDAFRDRVIFPIRNTAGDVAGFVGRDLSGNPKAPKYLNSRQSPLFTKSQLLYGLHEGLEHEGFRTEETARQPVVLEGPVDVLAVAARARATHQPRLLPVAACGTAFTAVHARFISDLVPDSHQPLVIALDGDAAGRAAALRAGDQARAAGLDARIAVLPTGLDPADYLARPDSTLDTFTETQAIPLLTAQVHDAIAAQGERMQWIEGRHAAARTIARKLSTYPVSHAARQIGWIGHVLNIDAATFTFQLADAYRAIDETNRHLEPTPGRYRRTLAL